MQKYLSNFQKILTDLLSVGDKIEEKIRTLILLSSFLSSFEFFVTALFMEKNTIKMDNVTSALLQNEILRQKNRASNLDSDSIIVVTGDGGGKG